MSKPFNALMFIRKTPARGFLPVFSFSVLRPFLMHAGLGLYPGLMLMDLFLQADQIIDWRHPDVTAQAQTLAGGCSEKRALAEACFSFVRDHIRHSVDFQCGPVTCAASEVLRHRSGYCYAKSHLLAALLRANGIPAALCYQRLRLDGPQTPFCLHGLNAVWLEEFGWLRLDARGNKPGVDARFDPPHERLAFALVHPGEADLPGLYAEPLPIVVESLRAAESWQSMLTNLPDLQT
jgi:transglutaminase-like putative cysteine protease